MIKANRLPQTYKELEYIVSNGSQFIANTYTVPTSATSFDVKIITYTSSAAEQCVVGTAAKTFEFGYGSVANRAFFYLGKSVAALSTDATIRNRKNEINAYVTSTNYAIDADFPGGEGEESTQYNISSVIGANLNIGAYYDAQSNYRFIGRIYNIQYATNGTIVRNFIPAKNTTNNTCGLYDIVGKRFYSNSGSGSFTAGPEKVGLTDVKTIKTKYNGTMQNVNHIMTKVNGQMVPIFEQGSEYTQESTTIPFSSTKKVTGLSLKDYKVYGNSKQGVLPEGYTQLVYIEATGTQYIRTGVNATLTSNLMVYIDAVAGITTGTGILVSGDGGYQAGEWFGATTVWTSGGEAVSNVPSTTRIQTTVKFGTAVTWELNGITYTRSGSLNSGQTMLFYTGVQSPYNFVGKLYKSKIWNNNELVRDFVPAKNSSDVVGLYDLISDTFFTNAGTGTFTAGPNAPTPDAPVEIVSVGDRTKNLFNKNDLEGQGYYNNSGTWTAEPGLYTYNLVEVKPNTRYFVSGLVVTALNSNVTLWDANGQFISRPARAKATTLSLTTTAATKYVKVCATEGSADTCQLEEGTTATAYEPYGYKIPVITYNNADCGIVDLGSLTWTGGSSYFSAKLDGIKHAPSASSVGNIYCKPYENVTALNIFLEEKDKAIAAHYETDYIWIRDTEYTDPNLFKAHLNGVYLYYELATSTSSSALNVNYVYLDEPLRKIGNYADYVDFKAGKVVRNIARKLLSTGGFTWNSGNTSRTVFRSNLQFVSDIVLPSSQSVKPDFMSEGFYAETAAATWIPGNIASNGGYVQCITAPDTTIEQFNTLTAGMSLYAGLTTPTEQTVTLPAIPTPKGTAIIDFDTILEPSKIKIIYKGK